MIVKRSEIGSEDLFYYQNGDEYITSASLKDLLDDHKIPAIIDNEALETYLSFGYHPGSKTLIKGVNKLRPGTQIDTKSGKIEDFFPLDEDNEPQKDVRTYARNIREQLTNAIESELSGVGDDEDIALFLTEGIDSLATIWILKNVFGKKVRIFYPVYDGEKFDNKNIVDKTLDELGVTAEPIYIKAQDALDLMPEYVHTMNDCSSNPDIFNTLLLAKKIPPEIKHVFSAFGADHLLGGTMFYLFLRDAEMYRHIYNLKENSEKRVLRFVSFLDDFTFTEKKRLCGVIKNNSMIEYLMPFFEKGDDILDQSVKWMLQGYIPNVLLSRNNVAQNYGFNFHSPFLKTDFVEFLVKIPSQIKVYGDVNKFLLNEAFKDVIFPKMIKSYTPDFHVPLWKWMQTDSWKDYIETTLSDSDYFEYSFLEPIIQSNCAGKEDSSLKLIYLLSFELWLREIKTRCYPKFIGKK